MILPRHIWVYKGVVEYLESETITARQMKHLKRSLLKIMKRDIKLYEEPQENEEQ